MTTGRVTGDVRDQDDVPKSDGECTPGLRHEEGDVGQSDGVLAPGPGQEQQHRPGRSDAP
eukprot:2405876-Amphidinium_carterae.2